MRKIKLAKSEENDSNPFSQSTGDLMASLLFYLYFATFFFDAASQEAGGQ